MATCATKDGCHDGCAEQSRCVTQIVCNYMMLFTCSDIFNVSKPTAALIHDMIHHATIHKHGMQQFRDLWEDVQSIGQQQVAPLDVEQYYRGCILAARMSY